MGLYPHKSSPPYNSINRIDDRPPDTSLGTPDETKTKIIYHQVYVTKLVYYEPFEHIDDAVKREWFIKGKNRKWKEDLINKLNPEWRDLTEEIMRCYR